MAIKWQVRKIAEEQGITVSQLADAADIAPGTATALWHGRPLRADLPILERVCNVLKCTPGDLLILEPEGANGDEVFYGDVTVNSSSPLPMAA
jgi:DNA-binding Xre family transcriptional regulator